MELTYPEGLPIVERRAELLETIAGHQVVVVAGETGSGKSTQLPKFCLELGRGLGRAEGGRLIGHTQPRRLAARAVAERVAEELGTTVGEAVGFSVRFTDRTGDATRLKVMTDGILLAEIQRDRDLSAYDTLIIDEAHERSLNIDFLLGYLHRLLPRRPDLKLIITSATIDTERFSAHFATASGDPAPIVEVSGRAYPVELRYRPIGADGDGGDGGGDGDQTSAIAAAVRELSREGPGDILVFLSGEREIRDTAEALGRLALPDTELLPLYARLSSAEQHRVFAPHPGRRIVLATNVAETSLTVPGIRYVVDPGTARISRYNRRTKVQRLPIEPVSQASANQRAGRCGRVAPGVCIRLYGEDDFAARPEFTEPEILRTNLASVILQMAAIRLGAVADFPFVDPPDTRSVADGIALLEELGALDRRAKGGGGRGGNLKGARQRLDGDQSLRLTQIGRRLARLPVDPRLGRMVLEADRNGCVREVLVIAAAMAIIDPRERPAEAQQQAAEAHRRFDDPNSDFVAYLNLWNHLRQLRHELSSSQFRKQCRAQYLNWIRVREWEDVHSQLRQIAGGLGIHQEPADRPADPDAIHRSLLAGLLSQIGTWDPERQEYRGARQSRFAIGRGSSLGKKRPAWVMAGELVETNRLWARTVAGIKPDWIERIATAADVATRSYGTAWWDERGGKAMTDERVSVFGLEVAKRRIPVRRVDLDLARDLFVWHALVQGEWEPPEPLEFLERNARARAEVEALEDRARRRDLLVDDDTLADLYAARLPADIATGDELVRWWRDERLRHPAALDLTVEELTDPTGGAVSLEQYPDRWPAGGGSGTGGPGSTALRLSYRFDPDDPLDGVTVDIPLDLLTGFDGAGLDWQVPGHRQELVTALVRSLPKPLRRNFVPVPDHVAAFLARATPADGPLLEVLGRELTKMTGDRIPDGAWALEDVPAHLRVNYRAVDERGRAVAWSKDLPALRARLASRAREAVAGAAADLEERGLTSWSIGALPVEVVVERDGRRVTAFPALVDEGATAGVRAFPTAAEAARAMRLGVRRLVLLQLPAGTKALRRVLDRGTELALAGGQAGSVGDVLADCVSAAVDQLLGERGPLPRDAVAFDALVEATRERYLDLALEAVAVVGRILGRVGELRHRLDRTDAVAAQPAVADIRAQLAALVHPGFVTATGTGRLRDLERYLTAMDRRLDGVAKDPARDRRLMAIVHQLEDEWAAVAGRDTGGSVRWMLEELRVGLFAQSVGTKGSVSEQRVRKAIAGLGSG